LNLVECTACGSKELIDQDNALVCAYCQSRYVPEQQQVDAVSPAIIEIAQTEFDVVLVNPGRKKLALVKTIVELTGVGIRPATKLVESTPQVVLRGVPRSRAHMAREQLEAVGATVTIQ
jgi:ribosomal protein L7/L12